jgi:hypothetical protein
VFETTDTTDLARVVEHPGLGAPLHSVTVVQGGVVTERPWLLATDLQPIGPNC